MFSNGMILPKCITPSFPIRYSSKNAHAMPFKQNQKSKSFPKTQNSSS